MTQDVEPSDAGSDGGLATLAGPASGSGPASAQRAKPKSTRARTPKVPGQSSTVALVFLAPAAILLAAIVFYPLVYSLIRSVFGDGAAGQAAGFVGLKNYGQLFSNADALRALRNNVLWVVIVPTLITILGLIFAVLTERIRWASVFKIVLFMPMAISFLASGVTWTLIYADQPSQGLGNAIVTSIHDTFNPTTSYPNLHTANSTVFTGSPSTGYVSVHTYSSSTPALVPVVGLNLVSPPKNAVQAALPTGGGVHGTVWNDFKLGGGGATGRIDKGELGIPALKIEAIQNGRTVATTRTGNDGSFAFPKLASGSYQLALPKSDFTAAYAGISWLGKDLITPAIMIAYLWIYAGFAMVLLAAGMAAIPRDTLEAARMDGATEWQVLRRVTVPLLAPVLMVVFVTMIINVLKVFDLVFIISQSAGANGKYANVLAVQLYSDYGNQQYGAASAVGIVLVILVLPAMVFQVRRFRKDAR